MKIIKMSKDNHLTYPITSDIKKLKGFSIDACSEIKKIVPKDISRDVVLLGRGSSGAVLCASIATILADEISNKVYVSYVYKPEEHSHGYSCNNIAPFDFVIICDDFTATGDTLRYIYKSLHKRCSKIPDAIVMGAIWGNLFEKHELEKPKYIITKQWTK